MTSRFLMLSTGICLLSLCAAPAIAKPLNINPFPKEADKDKIVEVVAPEVAQEVQVVQDPVVRAGNDGKSKVFNIFGREIKLSYPADDIDDVAIKPPSQDELAAPYDAPPALRDVIDEVAEFVAFDSMAEGPAPVSLLSPDLNNDSVPATTVATTTPVATTPVATTEEVPAKTSVEDLMGMEIEINNDSVSELARAVEMGSEDDVVIIDAFDEPVQKAKIIRAVAPVKRVEVEVPVEVIREVEVIKEVPVEVEVIREIEVVKEIEVIKEVPVFIKPQIWRAVRGADVYETLSFWSNDSEVQLVWAPEWSVPVYDTLEVQGSYEEAVQALLGQYYDQKSRIVGTLYIDPSTEKRTLVVENEMQI